MADIQFEQEAWLVKTEQVYASLLRAPAISRQIMPVEPILQEKDLQAEYWKWSQDYNSLYSMEPFSSPDNSFGMTKSTVNTPILHTGFNLTRTEMARIEASRFGIQSRLNALMTEFARDEDRVAIVGDADVGVTSFEDTTNNSTAATTHLDLTSEATMKTTIVAQIMQLATNLGGIANLKKFPLILLASEDVYNRAMAIGVTSYTVVDATVNAVDLATAYLRKYGNPQSGVFASNNLGATVTKAGDKYSVSAGTTNSALYAWSPDFLSILASPIKILTEDSPINGRKYQITERWVPAFKQPLAVIYDDTVDITA